MSQSVSYDDMSNDELIALYHECVHLANLYDIYQKVKKVLLNSLYGAVGNNYFKYYKQTMARSITLMGQCMINKAAKAKNEYLAKVLGDDPHNIKDRRIYSDTDSISGDSIIEVNGNPMSISAFYEASTGEEIEENCKYIKKMNDVYMTNSYSNNDIHVTPIKYAMKHKVKKKMYRIKVDDREIVCTEDHSLMVKRNNKLIECSPADMQKDDRLIVW